MKLLHIDSSIKGAESASRRISAAIVARLRAQDPTIEVTYRDLAAAPLPHLTLPAFAEAESQAVLGEFLAADVVVIGAGMYNFSVPSQLKAWIDRILVAGKTFRYTEKGPQGLVSGKRVLVALARGNFYGEGAPAAALEHAETYLRDVFAFISISDLEIIAADGTAVSPATRTASLEAAIGRTATLAA